MFHGAPRPLNPRNRERLACGRLSDPETFERE